LQFNQSLWLTSYIEFNTNKRMEAKHKFDKDFYKLLNNAMFGKTMENVRNRLNLELVQNEKRLKRLICKPNFKNRIDYSKTFCAVECSKESVLFNKPIYVGFSVLELSKLHMYDFHYCVMKDFYKNQKLNILYLDTDSFFYEVFTNDLYDDFLNLKQYLDLSDFPKEHKCFDNSNKKKLGCFKDECAGIAIVEFVGLRPKLYTFRTIDDNTLQDVSQMRLKKAKGVKKCVLDNHISFDDYKSCLFNNTNIRRDMRIFKSKKHCVHTVTVNKLSLSPNDDKRYVCEDNVKTLAYGHYSLRE